MDYKFIAEMRTGEIVTICEWDNIELFERIMNQFEEGKHISRFAIVKNNEVIKEKYLEPVKERRLVK